MRHSIDKIRNSVQYIAIFQTLRPRVMMCGGERTVRRISYDDVYKAIDERTNCRLIERLKAERSEYTGGGAIHRISRSTKDSSL